MKKTAKMDQAEKKRVRSDNIIAGSCEIASDVVTSSCDIVTKSCNMVTSTIRNNPLKSIGAAALAVIFLL